MTRARRDLRIAMGLFIVIGIVLWGPVMLAQAATSVGSPLESGQTNESVVAFIMAYAGSALLEWWKRSPFGGMTPGAAPSMKRVIAVATAVASAIGVHASFDAAAGILTISGLTWPGIWTTLGDSIRQFVFQQFIYRTAIEPKATT